MRKLKVACSRGLNQLNCVFTERRNAFSRNSHAHARVDIGDVGEMYRICSRSLRKGNGTEDSRTDLCKPEQGKKSQKQVKSAEHSTLDEARKLEKVFNVRPVLVRRPVQV